MHYSSHHLFHATKYSNKSAKGIYLPSFSFRRKETGINPEIPATKGQKSPHLSFRGKYYKMLQNARKKYYLRF
jgi:hypothetical protein